MSRLNCWQFKRCGREMGGTKSYMIGVCPAAVEIRLDGTNSGDNGGRACWVVDNTMCGGETQGRFEEKYRHCAKCNFYQAVREEEGASTAITAELLKRLS